MVVGAIMALACLSAIGAVTTLVVMAASTGPEAVAAHDRECAVVAWKAGEFHCFRSVFAGTEKPERSDLAVVAQASSGR